MSDSDSDIESRLEETLAECWETAAVYFDPVSSAIDIRNMNQRSIPYVHGREYKTNYRALVYNGMASKEQHTWYRRTHDDFLDPEYGFKEDGCTWTIALQSCGTTSAWLKIKARYCRDEEDVTLSCSIGRSMYGCLYFLPPVLRQLFENVPGYTISGIDPDTWLDIAISAIHELAHMRDTAWRRFYAASRIQRMWREARENPAYAICRNIEMRRFGEMSTSEV